MSASLVALRRVPERFDGAAEVNANFQALKAALERAIQTGALVADGAMELLGDVTGPDDDTTVEKVRNVTFGAPVSGDDGKCVVYSHGGPSFGYADKLSDVFTTRGDLIRRGASAEERFAVGGANTLLKSDGTDPSWATLTSLIDGAISSTQGTVLYRGAASWSALAPGASGQFLKTLGAGADPEWDTIVSDHGGLTGLADDDHTQYLLATGLREWSEQGSTPSNPAATNWKLYFKSGGLYYLDDAGVETGPLAAAGGGAHNLLSATHSDTTAASVVRGDIIVGDATPKWVRLAVGAAGKYLYSDGTDVSWGDPPASSAHNLLSATHSDTLSDSVVAGDILYGNSTPKWARLAKGSDGEVLTLVSGFPAWAAAGGSSHNLLSSTHSDTTAASVSRGDIITGQGASPTWSRLAIASRYGRLSAGANEPVYTPFTAWNTHVSLYPRWNWLFRGAVLSRGETTVSVSGTQADAGEQPIWASKFTNSTTTNAGIYATAAVPATWNPYFRAVVKVADMNDGCGWIGMHSAGLLTSTITGAGEMAAFRAYNGTDTNWQACTRDGTNLGNTDTGVAVDANWHLFEVYTPDQGTTWIFKIDGVQVASRTTNVPTTTTNLGPQVSLPYITSSTRDIRVQQLFMGFSCSDGNLPFMEI